MTVDKKNILLIQTAFIGDVILATCLIEQLKAEYPDASIDFVIRKSNAGVLMGNPNLRKVILWDKEHHKWKNLIKVVKEIRSSQYDMIINMHRFLSSGLMVLSAKGKEKIGYDKNPFSFTYNRKVKHELKEGVHEVDRLQALTAHLTTRKTNPRLHLLEEHLQKVTEFQKSPYFVIAPTSVWFTKQYPMEKWVDFLNHTAFFGNIYLIGAPGDFDQCEQIKNTTTRDHVFNLCGELKLLESAALMKGAVMNYVNDSAPMHLCSALQAPVKVIYCSTVPSFGFGPLSEESEVIEAEKTMNCRPCGLHGYRQCPEGHFDCAKSIGWERLEL